MRTSLQNLQAQKFENKHFENYFRLVSNLKVMEQITGFALNLAEARKKFDEILEYNKKYTNSGYYAFFLKNTEIFIGYGKITIEENENAEIGYILLPEFWGKGFASEIAEHLVEIGINNTKIKSLYAIIDPENGASKRILEKCNFSVYKNGEIDGLPAQFFQRKAE